MSANIAFEQIFNWYYTFTYIFPEKENPLLFFRAWKNIHLI
jgi:hypothetical protein